MEAASHGHPQSFQVVITVVLEQLKREELKKQRKRIEAYFRFLRQAFCFPPPCNPEQLGC
jgi:hypothetical protein